MNAAEAKKIRENRALEILEQHGVFFLFETAIKQLHSSIEMDVTRLNIEQRREIVRACLILGYRSQYKDDNANMLRISL